MTDAVATCSLPLPRGHRFVGTLFPLAQGRFDPTCSLRRERLVRAAHTPDGPVTLVVEVRDGTAHATAHGPGAQWQIERVPDLLGLFDEGAVIPAGLHPVVDEAVKAQPWPRFIKTHDVLGALIPIILGQKVTGHEQVRSFSRLARLVPQTAPGPFADLLLPPAPETVAGASLDELQGCGILRPQARTLKEVCRHRKKLTRLGQEDEETLRTLLPKIAGIGPWTVSCLFSQTRGDADAVVVGDFHLPHAVVHALTGRARGSDEEMLALLEPFRGQRARVVRLLLRHKGPEPSFGPRAPLRENPVPFAPRGRR